MPVRIDLPPPVASPLRHAADRLIAEVGTPADDSQATALDVIVDIDATDAALGDEGYHLVGTDEAAISVRASTSAGATNGLHALRRRVLVEGRRGTGSLPSPIDHQVVPGFGRRTVMVAPYPFGGQQGRSVLGADTWGIGRWTEYVEQLRLLNATGLALFPLRMWHPDFPDTFVEKARYEVWRDVMTLCHDVGLEFHWVMLLNQVPDGFLDARPDLAVEQNAAWQGTAAAWWKLGNPNELIALHEPTYEWFRDADAFAYMWNDGGAADYAPQTLSEPVTPLLELIAFARDRIAAAGSGARTVFWGWLMEPWYPFHAAIHLPNFPALATFHADALAALPKDMEWLQESARQYSALGISGYADPLEAAQDAGFDKLTDFYYLSHPEVAEQIFPRPLLADVRAEIEHARARRDGDHRIPPLSGEPVGERRGLAPSRGGTRPPTRRPPAGARRADHGWRRRNHSPRCAGAHRLGCLASRSRASRARARGLVPRHDPARRGDERHVTAGASRAQCARALHGAHRDHQRSSDVTRGARDSIRGAARTLSHRASPARVLLATTVVERVECGATGVRRSTGTAARVATAGARPTGRCSRGARGTRYTTPVSGVPAPLH